VVTAQNLFVFLAELLAIFPATGSTALNRVSIERANGFLELGPPSPAHKRQQVHISYTVRLKREVRPTGQTPLHGPPAAVGHAM